MVNESMSRRVVKALSLFGSLQVVTMLCSIVRIKLVAIWIGAVGMGLFSIFNSAVMFIATLTQLSLRTTGVREIAATPEGMARDRKTVIIRRLGWILGLFGVAFTLLCSPLLSRQSFGDWGHTVPFMLLSAAILFQSLQAAEQTVMQGTDCLKALASSTLWGSVVALAISLPLIWWLRLDGVIPTIITYAAGMYVACRWFRQRPPRVSLSLTETLRESAPLLRLGFYMTVATAVCELINYLVIAYVTTRGGEAQTGIFQAGYSIVTRYFGMIFTAISVEFFPRLSGVADSRHRVSVFVSHELTLVLLIITPLLMAFYPLAGLAIRILYSGEFLDAIPYVYMAVPGLAFKALSWCLGLVILARGDGRTYMVTETLSSVLILVLSILLYDRMGMAGLGLASASECVVYALIIWVVYRRRYGLGLSVRSMALWCVSSVLLVACAVTVWCVSPWWTLAAALPFGALSCLWLKKLLA